MNFGRSVSLGWVVLGMGLMTGCNGGGDGASTRSPNLNSDPTELSGDMQALGFKKRWPSSTPTVTPSPSPSPSAPAPSPSPTSSSASVDALIYWGAGVENTGAQALVEIIRGHGGTYHIVNSAQLNAMSVAQLANYRTIVWPGGDSNVADASLTSTTRIRVREAVQSYGVGFAGFCAGAWIAVGPAPSVQGPYWGFALITADYLKLYYPNGTLPTAAIVPTTFADGSVRDLVWWGGPVLPSLSGKVIAKYPTGSAAIIQSYSGKGFVSISGPHPEAPQSWRDGEKLVDRDGLDTEIAWSLIRASMQKAPQLVF